MLSIVGDEAVNFIASLVRGDDCINDTLGHGSLLLAFSGAWTVCIITGITIARGA